MCIPHVHMEETQGDTKGGLEFRIEYHFRREKEKGWGLLREG